MTSTMGQHCLVCDVNVVMATDYQHIFKDINIICKLERILSIRLVEAVCTAPYLCAKCTEKLEAIVDLIDNFNQAYRQSLKKHNDVYSACVSKVEMTEEVNNPDRLLSRDTGDDQTADGPKTCHLESQWGWPGCFQKRDAGTQIDEDDFMAEMAEIRSAPKAVVKRCRGQSRKSKRKPEISQNFTKCVMEERRSRRLKINSGNRNFRKDDKKKDEEMCITETATDECLSDDITEADEAIDISRLTSKDEEESNVLILHALECHSIDPDLDDVTCSEETSTCLTPTNSSTESAKPDNIPKKKTKKPQSKSLCKNTKNISKKRLLSKIHSAPLGEKRYKCDECGASFAKGDKLKRHVRVHTGEKPYICPNCNRRFAAKYQMQRHNMQIHTGERPFKCSVCGHGFTELKALRIHMRKHTGERPYSCTLCLHSFSQAYSLKLHMRSHTGEYPYKCDHCAAGFSRADTYKVHLRRHTGEKPYKCSECDAHFADPQNFKKHQRHHKGDRPYKCPVCSTAFVQSNSLKEHMRKHTGERPYLCSTCGASFAHQSSFSQHCRAHTGEKPHQCPHCSKAFADARVLKVHVRTHTGERPFMCSTCGKAFAHHGQLSRHIFSHTGERPHQCYLCGKRFARKDKMNRHIRRIHGQEDGFQGPPYPIPDPDTFLENPSKEIIRPHECHLCSKRYSRKDKLKDHIRKTHVQPIEEMPVERHLDTDPVPTQGLSYPTSVTAAPVSITPVTPSISTPMGVVTSTIPATTNAVVMSDTESNQKYTVLSSHIHPYNSTLRPSTHHPLPDVIGTQLPQHQTLSQTTLSHPPQGLPVGCGSAMAQQRQVPYSTVSPNMCQQLSLTLLHHLPTQPCNPAQHGPQIPR